jgi:nucleoside-diphosphate-sugar epimerase
MTGASGEIGHGLIERLGRDGSRALVTLDVVPLDAAVARFVQREVTGSILDRSLLERLLAEYDVDLVFHLAALLSTRGEFSPVSANEVNVGGTLNLLEFARHEAESHGRPVAFLYPSSIAAYGLPSLDEKRRAGVVHEDQFAQPATMYGCNKLYCEQLGRYYALHYKQLSAAPSRGPVDFRAIRFPGLISAETVPSGGTSDYAAEMFHRAARGEPYSCFVRPETRIPFLAMPDAVEALVTLSGVARERLSRTTYNVRGFSATADEIRAKVLRAFPAATIDYLVHEQRQRIVDSWPEDVDDRAARADWGFAPVYDFQGTFRRYLVPGVSRA